MGYHCDQLTYLGPRAVIGSLSLGVAREFRVRKIVARDEADPKAKSPLRPDNGRADAEGQIAIHLPHNSLLVMHAEMQEEWKHSIHPAPVIDPHPIAGNKRINSKSCRYPDFSSWDFQCWRSRFPWLKSGLKYPREQRDGSSLT